jgi:hypothetical protein
MFFKRLIKTGLIAGEFYDALARRQLGNTIIGLYQQALQRLQDIPFNGLLFCIECHRW